MSRFVQRDNAGNIIGSYAVAQVGYAEEEVDDGDLDLAAFVEKATPRPRARNLMLEFDALKAALINKGTIAEKDL